MPLPLWEGHFQFILLPVGSESLVPLGSPVPMWAISPWKNDIPHFTSQQLEDKRDCRNEVMAGKHVPKQQSLFVYQIDRYAIR